MGTMIRVMSFNIHSGIGTDGRYDLKRIADVIRGSGAEIVGLQEADVHWGNRSMNEDTVQQLAKRLGMNAFFAPIYDLDSEQAGIPSRKFGNALLTGFPIHRAENHELSRLSTQKTDAGPAPMPGFAEVTLAVEGTPVSVYVTHLDYRANSTIREKQVGEMHAMMSGNTKPTLLLGDFNAKPDATELAPLFSRLTDTWPEANRVRDGFTFPSDKPDRKIDYILAGAGFRTISSAVIPTRASDHLPIIADLQLIAQTVNKGDAQ